MIREFERKGLPGLTMLLVFLVGVLLITYVPWMTTFLPHYFPR